MHLMVLHGCDLHCFVLGTIGLYIYVAIVSMHGRILCFWDTTQGITFRIFSIRSSRFGDPERVCNACEILTAAIIERSKRLIQLTMETY